jgi:hypothetical protein
MKTACPKHPKYKVNKKPKHQCLDCLSLYLKFKGTRKPTAPPTKVMKSLKDYTRKLKHKIKE